MKEIDLEKLATILTEGLTEQVELSGRICAFTGKDVHSMIMDYKGVAMLSPSSGGLQLTMKDTNFYFKPRATVLFEAENTTHYCPGINPHNPHLIIPIDLTQEAIVRFENVKHIKF